MNKTNIGSKSALYPMPVTVKDTLDGRGHNKSDGMMRLMIVLISTLVYMAATAQNRDINAVDVHSHLMTKPYLECLERHGALMEDENESYSGKPIPEPQCKKLPMAEDGIVRLSRIEVYPQYLDEYMKMATEVGAASLRTEPGVLTMYAVADKKNPCLITILETYASQDAYKSHIASPHFQKYKQGTLHMVKSLELCDQNPLNPDSKIINTIK